MGRACERHFVVSKEIEVPQECCSPTVRSSAGIQNNLARRFRVTLTRNMGFLALCLFGLSASAPAQQALVDPLRFFEGRTESKGSIKIVFKKATKTYSAGRGRIESDGSLLLVQQVSDEGKEPHERRWRIRQVSSGRFVGTMTDAV